MNKKNLDFPDLLMDEDFIKHAKNLSTSASYIKDLKELYPDRVEDIDKSMLFLKSLDISNVTVSDDDKNRVWNRIITQHQRKRVLLPIYISSAASILLLITIGVSTILDKEHQRSIDYFAHTISEKNRGAGLFISDETFIPVDGEESTVIYSNDGSQVKVNNEDITQKDVDVSYNQLIVPHGKSIHLELSDGSKVWVYSGSKLIYPPVFNKKNREVFLEGQAYFEVASNVSKPFIVKTDYFTTKAVGTKFVVNANSTDQICSTILLEGKVKLSGSKSSHKNEVTLCPGQQGAIDKNKEKFNISQVDHPENYISWIHGYFVFDNEDLNGILKRVSQYYDVEITLPNNYRKVSFTGKLELKEDVNTVLHEIANFSNLHVDFDGKECNFYN